MQPIKKLIRNAKKSYSNISNIGFRKWWDGKEVTLEDKWEFYDSKAELCKLKSICANTDSRKSRRWDKKYEGAKECAQDLIRECFAEREEMRKKGSGYSNFFKER